MKNRTAAIAATAITVALALAGCTGAGMDGMDHAGDAPSSEAAQVGFNAADEAFLMGMIPHHEQAIEMADLVLEKDGVDGLVADLAERILAAQQPEIDLMSSWLREWGADDGADGMAGMDHGGGGMMSDDDMAALRDASGSEASALFLEQMIEHHTGAIMMARMELENGVNQDALDLAQRIIDDQTAEIALMQELLAQL
jgi:uncharacterized protein (DUF305 family)